MFLNVRSFRCLIYLFDYCVDLLTEYNTQIQIKIINCLQIRLAIAIYMSIATLKYTVHE